MRRVSEYKDELDGWCAYYFVPMMDCIRLYSLSWASVVEWIGVHKAELQSSSASSIISVWSSNNQESTKE